MEEQVRYIGTTQGQVAWGGNADPRPWLMVGHVYTVARREAHSWHTKIELKEHPGLWFNDTSFRSSFEDLFSEEEGL